jgi:uncharacterized protein
MTVLQGRGITRGRATGKALVTRMPLNLTAAHTKFHNLLSRGQIRDRHHELFRERVGGRVLVFPRCVGSTFAGVVLLELIYREASPLAIVVGEADSLLVSGAVLADVWFDRAIPVVECRDPGLFDQIRTGDCVTVDADTGEILVG